MGIMTTLEEKVQGIKQGHLKPLEALGDLESVKHKTCTPRQSCCYYFEESTSLSSSWILPKSSLPFRLFIGAYSYMNFGGVIRDNVIIGRYVSIGRCVSIAAGMHPLTAVSTSTILRGSNNRSYSQMEIDELGLPPSKLRSQFTEIGSDSWIGDGSIIMPGVVIGVGCVIGANSVVTSDIPAYAIAVGAPAKVIRFRFNDQAIKDLLATQWWNIEHEILQSLPMKNVAQMLKAFKERSPSPYNYITYTVE